MILYCSALPVFLYRFIVHKLTRYKSEEVILLVDESAYKKRDFIRIAKNLEENEVFSKVIFESLFIRKNDDKEVIINNCIEHFDNIFEKIGYQLSDFKKIYVMNDNWDGDINLYFNIKQVNYIWVETATNCLFENKSFQFNKAFNEIVDEYKSLSPFAKYAQAEILNESNKSKEILREKRYSTWDLQKELNDLSQEEFFKVTKSFEINNIDIKAKSALLVVNSYGYASNCPGSLKKLSEKRQLELGVKDYTDQEIFSVLDKTAIDYYASEAEMIYLKSHPHDPISSTQLRKLYGEKWNLLGNAPFEFIQRYLQENKVRFEYALGYASASLKVLSEEFCDTLFLLGEDYFRTWHYYESIYATLLLSEKVGVSDIYTHPYISSQMKLMLAKEIVVNNNIRFEDISNIRSLTDKKNSMIIIDAAEIEMNFSKVLEDTHESNVVCFLNVQPNNILFDDQIMYGFVPIILKKEIRETNVNLLKEETIWLFSKNARIRGVAREFNYKHILKNLGCNISVNKISLNQCFEIFEKNQVYKVRKEYENLEKTFLKIMDVFTSLDNHSRVSEMLREEKDIKTYLEMLRIVKQKYLIVISVKDTPGSLISKDVQNSLKRIGFTNFSSELWRMYIGIVFKNSIKYNVAGDKVEDSVLYQGEINGTEVFVSSKSWRNGNVADIYIKNCNYSLNKRGINIVVYDMDTKRLVDSVNYDAHDNNFKFMHLKNI